jgi:hypothetical protein
MTLPEALQELHEEWQQRLESIGHDMTSQGARIELEACIADLKDLLSEMGES